LLSPLFFLLFFHFPILFPFHILFVLLISMITRLHYEFLSVLFEEVEVILFLLVLLLFQLLFVMTEIRSVKSFILVVLLFLFFRLKSSAVELLLLFEMTVMLLLGG
jgi:hypothetical protein